jgi:beta-lactamase class A
MEGETMHPIRTTFRSLAAGWCCVLAAAPLLACRQYHPGTARGAPSGPAARPAAAPRTAAASPSDTARGGDAARLEARVRARLDSLDARTYAYARDLGTGREIAVRADEPVNTVSVIKLPIMVLAYRDAEAGRLNLDERYTIRDVDLRRGTGVLQTFAVGLQPTWRDLVTQMIITSDNSATDILIARLGLDRVNAMLDSLGYRETRLRMPIGQLFRGVWEQLDPQFRTLTDREVFERGFPDDAGADARYRAYVADSTRWFGRTTAREVSRFLEQIQRGQLAGPRYTEEMLQTLREQVYSSRLPQRIRFAVAVGHKTGDWPPLIGNDVGIVYAERGPIVVSVFTNENRGSFVDLEATIGRVAEDVLVAWGGKR